MVRKKKRARRVRRAPSLRQEALRRPVREIQPAASPARPAAKALAQYMDTREGIDFTPEGTLRVKGRIAEAYEGSQWYHEGIDRVLGAHGYRFSGEDPNDGSLYFRRMRMNPSQKQSNAEAFSDELIRSVAPWLADYLEVRNGVVTLDRWGAEHYFTHPVFRDKIDQIASYHGYYALRGDNKIRFRRDVGGQRIVYAPPPVARW